MKVALIAAALAVCGTVASLGNDGYRGYDLDCFWNGARAVVRGEDPYDRTAWEAATRATAAEGARPARRDPCPGRYAYPLWTAIVMAPLGWLPLVPAAALWMALGIGAAVAGLDLCWRAVRGPRGWAPLLAILVIFSLPFWRFLVLGQLSGVLLGLIGATAYLRSRGDARAGLALGALALKPQLAAVIGPAAVARDLMARRWRPATLGAGVVFALAAASLAIDRGWPSRWLEGLGDQRLPEATKLPTLWALFGEVGQPLLAIPAVIALAAAVWWTVRPAAIDEVRFLALALPFCLVLAPYLYSYDHLLLALTWARILADASVLATRARALALLALVASASALPWIFYAIGFAADRDTLNALPPLLGALLLAATTRLRATVPTLRPAMTP